MYVNSGKNKWNRKISRVAEVIIFKFVSFLGVFVFTLILSYALFHILRMLCMYKIYTFRPSSQAKGSLKKSQTAAQNKLLAIWLAPKNHNCKQLHRKNRNNHETLQISTFNSFSKFVQFFIACIIWQPEIGFGIFHPAVQTLSADYDLGVKNWIG